MKKNILCVVGLAGTLLLSGCTQEKPEDESSFAISEEAFDDATTEASDAAEQLNSATEASSAAEASSEASTGASSGEYQTVYGSKFTIPEGFVEDKVDAGEFEKNNAAGGYSTSFHNNSLGMTIEVNEFIWTNIVPDGTKEDFLKQNYECYAGVIGESNIAEDSFYIAKPDEGDNYTYVYERVTDKYCVDLNIIYPIGDSECEAIKDEFINSYTISEE